MKRVIRDIKIGATRYQRGFLFWPKKIGEELRWLEWAEWEEEARAGLKYDLFVAHCVLEWVATEWIN